MMGQMKLDLYGQPKTSRYVTSAVEDASHWLRKTHGCTSPLIEDMASALYDKFPGNQAFERCKCVTLVDGNSRVDGWTWWDLTEVIGIFTEKDYHTCWDRCWAARQGWPKEKVRKLEVFAYGKGEHLFK